MVRICTGEVCVRKQQPVAQWLALLIGNHQRVLRVARRMPWRKIHALEVVVVGLDLRTHSDRIAQRRKYAGDLIERLGNRMLGASQSPRPRQRDVDGFGCQRRISTAPRLRPPPAVARRVP